VGRRPHRRCAFDLRIVSLQRSEFAVQAFLTMLLTSMIALLVFFIAKNGSSLSRCQCDWTRRVPDRLPQSGRLPITLRVDVPIQTLLQFPFDISMMDVTQEMTRGAKFGIELGFYAR
jgi:hypothetical protein